MKIMLKINGSSESLINSLVDFRPRLSVISFNGKIICSPYYDKAKKMLFVPSEVIRYDYSILPLIDCEERIYNDIGSVKVICGVGGKPLRPYLVCKRKEVQARFGVPYQVIEITALQWSSVIMINKSEIIMKGTALALKSQKIWSGFAADLPPGLSHFAAAVRAAQNKARGLNPTGVHFVEEKNILNKKMEDHGK